MSVPCDELSLFLLSSKEAKRLAVAWPLVTRGVDNCAVWLLADEAWRDVRFDLAEWARLAQVSTTTVEQLGPSLMRAGLVQPEGTLPELVRKALKKELAMKTWEE